MAKQARPVGEDNIVLTPHATLRFACAEKNTPWQEKLFALGAARERNLGAAEQFGINRLIRVCSDNPFLRADSFQALLEAHDCQPADYVAFGWPDGRPTIKSHIGLFAELTTLDALRRAASLTDEQLYHEHVTIYLYTHPEAFSVRLLPLPTGLESRQDLRFTLDTPDDFSLLGSLYAEWYEKTDRSLSALLQTVDARPEYLERMRENIKRNEK